MEEPEDTGEDRPRPQPDPAQIERGFRKMYLSFALKAFAGILVFALLWFIPLPSKWLALPFILVGGWLVLVNLYAIGTLATVQSRYWHGPDDNTPMNEQDKGEAFLHYTGFVFLFAAILGVVPMSRFVENIVEGGKWILEFGAVGVVLAAFTLWLVKQRLPNYFRSNEKRASSILGLFFGIIAMVILVPAWIDRERAKEQVEVRRYALERTGENIKSNAKYLHLYYTGQKESTFRIRVRSKELEAAKGRDSVDLRIGTGDLGFTHVLEVVPTPR